MTASIHADLYRLIAPTLKRTGVEYAIGGATAMSAAGYTRQTDDLDVFFKHTDAPTVLRDLCARRIIFATIADPYHFAIIPDVMDPDHRVDLLFTSDDPEVDAVDFPDEAVVRVGSRRVTVNVVPALLIKTTKVRSSRGKDHDDVRRMYERGLIDPAEVLTALQHYGERGAAKRIKDILAGRVPRE